MESSRHYKVEKKEVAFNFCFLSVILKPVFCV